MHFSATNFLACSLMALSMTTTIGASSVNHLKLKVSPLDWVISDYANMPKNVPLVRKLSEDGEYGAEFRMQNFESVASIEHDDFAVQPDEDRSRNLLRGRQ